MMTIIQTSQEDTSYILSVTPVPHAATLTGQKFGGKLYNEKYHGKNITGKGTLAGVAQWIEHWSVN